ncbi:glycosyltransferase family 1 protein [bacterium]|nr:MAG: glycosyltransferase family 1 protein [bacterium]
MKFLIRRFFSRKPNWRIGFLSFEFEHLELMPFGGYGMTLKFVTDYLNNNGKPLKADVLMSEGKDIPAVTAKRYHSADLIFMPKGESPLVYFQCVRALNRRGINVFIGIDHARSYEYYLRNFPYINWVVWIKDPKDRKIFEKILTVSLEAKTWGNNIDGLIKQGEEDAESLRRMIKVSRGYGRKIYFGAEASHLAEIARRKYDMDDINAFHWPNPIPLPDITEATFSERPSFLLLGRLDPIKRPWIFCELARRFKDADFYVAGKSHYPEIVDPVLAKYKDLPNLKFMGRIEGKDKAVLLDRVWAVVNTSIHEGVPVSLLEGFSYGKPAIAALNPDGLTSRFGIYVGEVFGNGDDTQSLDRFSSAIERVINGELDKEKIGQEARQYIATVHSFEYFESTLLRVLNTPNNFQYKVY